MKQVFVFALALSVLFACQSPKESSSETAAQDSVIAAPVRLALKWETDSVLTTCESVLYDAEKDVLYVSNINGSPDGRDGNGFISKVSLDGQVTELEWVKGLDAPKGMGLYKGKLYVTDIDRIHEIETASGKISKTHKVEAASFLNDITVDSAGSVYVSDSNTGKIHLIEGGKVFTWLEGLQGPNGLHAEGGKLLTALWGSKALQQVDVASKEVSMKTDSLEGGDGIEAIGDGAYLVSSWFGTVHHIDKDWNAFTILDLKPDSANAADIEYIQEKKLLLVPTFSKNTVRAYELSSN